MKKTLIFCEIFILALFLSGCCNNKGLKLECIQNAQIGDVLINAKYDENGDIIDLGIKTTIDLSNNSDTEIEDMKSQDMCPKIKENVEEYQDAFSDCKQVVKDKRIFVSADLDIDKISSGISRKTTIDEAKERLSSQGFYCIINE